MGRFVNSENGVTVNVADDKDERFASPLWVAEKASTSTKAPARKAAADSK